MPRFRSAPSLLRDVGLFALTLLLALGPFLHGHLGTPRQFGWHVHVQASAPVVISTAGDALAQPAEPPDVELAPSLAARRLALGVAGLPDLAPAPAAAVSPAAALPTVVAAWAMPLAQPLPPSARGHLRPLPQAPPVAA